MQLQNTKVRNVKVLNVRVRNFNMRNVHVHDAGSKMYVKAKRPGAKCSGTLYFQVPIIGRETFMCVMTGAVVLLRLVFPGYTSESYPVFPPLEANCLI